MTQHPFLRLIFAHWAKYRKSQEEIRGLILASKKCHYSDTKLIMIARLIYAKQKVLKYHATQAKIFQLRVDSELFKN